MDEEKHQNDKKFTVEENSNNVKPIKQLYHLNGKYFIVLHESIIDRLKLSDDNNYFRQEATTDNKIILQLVESGR